MDAWLKYYDKLKCELQVTIKKVRNSPYSSILQAALGKISFTVDMWSSAGMQPYLSVTIHWLGQKEEQVLLCQALLAFRRVRGAHSGQRLARIIFDICDQAAIIGKVTAQPVLNSNLFADLCIPDWALYHG
jgi:hypothetical protein